MSLFSSDHLEKLIKQRTFNSPTTWTYIKTTTPSKHDEYFINGLLSIIHHEVKKIQSNYHSSEIEFNVGDIVWLVDHDHSSVFQGKVLNIENRIIRDHRVYYEIQIENPKSQLKCHFWKRFLKMFYISTHFLEAGIDIFKTKEDAHNILHLFAIKEHLLQLNYHQEIK